MIAYTLADFGRLVNLHDSFGPGLCNLQQAPGLSELIAATISSDRTGGGSESDGSGTSFYHGSYLTPYQLVMVKLQVS